MPEKEKAYKKVDATVTTFLKEDRKTLKTRRQPLSYFGSTYEIVTAFSGRPKYLQAIKELETEIYKTA
ncbi:MAG TPA: hypothetical protein VGE24_13510 [Emticicia sp.]